MTQPDWGRQISPSPTIHIPPAPVKSVPALTPQQIGVIGEIIVDLVLAQVALALGAINILGVRPFASLTEWGEALQRKAKDAYDGAFTAQKSANFANSQLTILTGGALASGVTGGVAIADQFNGASAANLPSATWTLVASDGAGAGSFGLDGSGLAVWKKSGGLLRRHIYRNTTALATDYQAVFCLMATPPENPYLGSDAYTYLCARMNTAGTTFVWARIGNNDLAVGKTVGGTWSTWTTIAGTISAGDQWSFLVGTDTDDCQVILKQNGVTRITHTATHDFGSGYRNVGVGALAGDRGILIIPFLDQTRPGELDLWSAADRLNTSI